MPVATTLKLAGLPAVTVRLAGWVAMEGATAAGLTVKVAVLLATLPAELVTTTA